MKRVTLEIQEFPAMYHIVMPERRMHIYNRAARPDNIMHAFFRPNERTAKPAPGRGKLLPMKRRAKE